MNIKMLFLSIEPYYNCQDGKLFFPLIKFLVPPDDNEPQNDQTGAIIEMDSPATSIKPNEIRIREI